MSRLNELLTGRALELYQESSKPGPEALARMRDDLALLDGHVRLRVEALAGGSGSSAGSIERIREAKASVDSAQASGSAELLGDAMSKLWLAIDRGASETEAWRELGDLMRKRAQLFAAISRLDAQYTAGNHTWFARRKADEMVYELALAGHSRVEITRATGMPARSVTRRIARLREVGRRQSYDVKDAVATLRARYDRRRAWLFEMRGAARSVFDVTRLAAEETRIDMAEADLLVKVGVLTVMAQALLDERALARARNMPTEQVEAELKDRARILLETVTGLATRPVE